MSARDWTETGMSQDEYSLKLQLSEAWLAKFQQVYDKACITLSDDPSFKKIQSIYATTTRKIEVAGKSKKRIKLDWGVVAIIAIFVLLITAFVWSTSEDKKMDASNAVIEERLRDLVLEIKEDIANKDYDSALIKAYTIHWNGYYSGHGEDTKEYWDEQRESLIKLIEEKKAGS